MHPLLTETVTYACGVTVYFLTMHINGLLYTRLISHHNKWICNKVLPTCILNAMKVSKPDRSRGHSYLQKNFRGTSTFMTLAVFLSGVIFRWFRRFFQIPYIILQVVFVKGSFNTWIFFWKSEFAVFLDWDGSIKFLISCFFIDFHLHGSGSFWYCLFKHTLGRILLTKFQCQNIYLW